MDNLMFRLRRRAQIRRQIPTRKSVQEGKPDLLADLLDEAANAIDQLLEERAIYLQEIHIIDMRKD